MVCVCVIAMASEKNWALVLHLRLLLAFVVVVVHRDGFLQRLVNLRLDRLQLSEVSSEVLVRLPNITHLYLQVRHAPRELAPKGGDPSTPPAHCLPRRFRSLFLCRVCLPPRDERHRPAASEPAYLIWSLLPILIASK